jgi:hypothetical protein
MATQFTDELQAEAPPSKRVCFQHPEDIQETTMEIMEDNYHAQENEPVVEAPQTSHTEIQKIAAAENSALNMKGIPGLGLLGQTPGCEQRSITGGNRMTIHLISCEANEVLLQIMKKTWSVQI